MTGEPRVPARGGRPAAFLAVLLALAFGACGARRLGSGSVPFPAETPVLVDSQGRERADLPAATAAASLLVLDFPWCPECADAWEAVRGAAASLPPGSLHVYRILFDRERLFTPTDTFQVAPLAPGPRQPPLVDSAGSEVPVTTLSALPDAFLGEFRMTQVPVLLLLDGKGMVVRRWTGHSPSLGDAVAEEIRRTAGVPLSPGR